jgi:hypothetical protein
MEITPVPHTRLVLWVLMEVTTVQDMDNRMAMEMPAPVSDSEAAVDPGQMETAEMPMNLPGEGEEVGATPEARAGAELLVGEMPVEEEAGEVPGCSTPPKNTPGEYMLQWQGLEKRSGTDTDPVICARRWIAIWTEVPYHGLLTRL